MTAIGYALSSEEHGPRDLVANARAAEEAGFSFALISDHFHPWIERHPHSPFVWGVLGAIAQATDKLVVGTGVTCPTFRTHPAIIAHAAATAADLMPGRFFLGVGTGENLNEHILGQAWPEWEVRAEMLEEAVEVIRELWKGKVTSHRGRHYTVQNARLYTLPKELPRIHVAAGGERMAEVAGRIGDGLIATAPDKKLLGAYRASRRRGSAVRPGDAVLGGLGARGPQDRPRVVADRRAARRSDPGTAEPGAVHGPRTERHRGPGRRGRSRAGRTPTRIWRRSRNIIDAGYDHVYLHQVGPDQDGFLEFARKELLPRIGARTPVAV